MKNKRIVILFFSVVALLLIPLIAMQFTDEVNWTLSDFIVAGVLLFGTALLSEIAWRKIKNPRIRIFLCLALLLLLLLVWVDLAVGIFGFPWSGN